MQVNTQTYLTVIPLTQLESWSVQSLLESKVFYNNKYPLINIGKFLSKNRTTTNIQDNIEYRRVTIKMRNGGVVERDKERGINIGTKKQYIAQKGQFIISKIDARNGAFGIVPSELNGAIVTNDFPLFDVNSDVINIEFLVLITTTKEFIKFAQSCSSGTTNRQRMDIDLFLNQKIPLPPIEEQNRIVDAYYKAVNAANGLDVEASKIEAQIQAHLVSQLGIRVGETKAKGQILQFVKFSNTERWDALFLLSNHYKFDSQFSLKRFSDIITSFNAKDGISLRIESSKFGENAFVYIGMENVEKETGELRDIATVKGKEVKSQTLKVPKNYIIYGKLRPYLNKYWINTTDFNNIICSSEFFVFDILDNVNKDFFKYILSSKIIQDQISDQTSGARMPRITEDIFMNLKFPLPPIEVQDKMVSVLNDMKVEIKIRKNQSTTLIEQAKKEFEKEIFGQK